MKTSFRKSFVRDVKKTKKQDVLDRIRNVIDEVEAADDLAAVGGVKKLSGTTDLFRIRIGEYRIGIALDDDTVEFIRCLPRRELYRYFP